MAATSAHRSAVMIASTGIMHTICMQEGHSYRFDGVPITPGDGYDHKNLLHACRRHLCPGRTSAVDPDCDGVVRHLEWRRCAVLGELDCRRRGERVELHRLPRRHAQLKANASPA